MTAMHTPLVPAWHDQALCAQTDPEIWFPPKGELGTEALAICAACPVQAECLDDAIATRDIYIGIRGGKTSSQRRELARNQAKHCKWCDQPLDPTVDGRQRFHPDCLRQRKNARQREYDLTYTRPRKTA